MLDYGNIVAKVFYKIKARIKVDLEINCPIVQLSIWRKKIFGSLIKSCDDLIRQIVIV